MPTKTWVVGEEVLAADFNTYVQQQVVARFATVAARDAAWPAATAGVGALSMTTDTGSLWQVIASTWVRIGGAPVPWILATLLNGWVATPSPLSYRKVGDIVYLRGGARSGGSTVFVLPAGYRPAVTEVVPMLLQGGILGYCVLDAATGNVTFNGANNADCQISAQFSVTA